MSSEKGRGVLGEAREGPRRPEKAREGPRRSEKVREKGGVIREEGRVFSEKVREGPRRSEKKVGVIREEGGVARGIEGAFSGVLKPAISKRLRARK